MRILLMVLAITCATPISAQAPIRVLTFNIRYGTANDGEHAWPNRRAHVLTTVRDHAPHLLGVQEALRFQLDEIGAGLQGRYQEIGVGRDDGKTKGEYSAILVDTSRFEILTNGQFWFSDTPEQPGSMSWGNRVTRLATWVRLFDRATGDTMRVFNQHWDHESQPSREKSARMLLDRAAALQVKRAANSPGDLLLVMGDFNSGENNPAFGILQGDQRIRLRDTFRALHADAKVVGTFHAFKGDSTGDKIDAILMGDGWQVLDAAIDRRRFGALWASDHFAVSALLRASGRGRKD